MKPLLASTLAVGITVALFADFRVEPPDTSIPFAPVKALAPVGLAFKDGVMYKEGRPHYWIGNGDSDAASQQGHFGIWLAWLQGADAVTLNHGTLVTARRDEDGVVVVQDRPDIGIISWRREATRLGLLSNFFHSHEPDKGGQTLTAEAYQLSLDDPELHEVYYHVGHHLGWDTGSDRGLDFSLTHRSAIYEYLKADPMTAYMEIAREPGANPTNQRVRRDFREWAKRKYGTIEAADRVWGVAIKHASWDDVQPPHLDHVRYGAKKSYEDILMRNRARAEAPNFYDDWRQFLQDDTTRMMARELTELRKRAPWAPSTVDVRGHFTRDDCYSMLVPERISPFVDLFSIHYGSSFFEFEQSPWDRASVLSMTATHLWWENYFRCNTTGPIVNSENIFSDARSPMSSLEKIKENDMGQLCAQKWRIRKDEDWTVSRRWIAPSFDDSSWDVIAVPGCWDQAHGTAYENFRGTCWLRRTFDIPGSRKQDFVDGSCVFKLVGQGVAHQGDVWLNGHKLNIRKIQGWSTPYDFDVGPFLNWGGRNVLVWRVEGCGKSDNGLRFPSYILTDDQLSKKTPFNEKHCRLMSFAHLMGGLSGNWMWHWHADGVRTYQPRLKAQLNAVAEAALPAIRNRRGRVAFLYCYFNGPGLLYANDPRHYLDYYDAIEFNGVKPDVYGEEKFRSEVTPEKYPLLVAPIIDLVEPATYAHFKAYVAAGGTAIITENSFARTRDRYEATDIADYLAKRDFGKGRVAVLSSRAELGELLDELKPYLPEPEVKVDAETKDGERPLIERMLVGNADRKVLYLANWGGQDHTLAVRVPDTFREWKPTAVVGTFTPRGAEGGYRVTVPSQDIAALLLDRPGAQGEPLPKVSPTRQKLLDELAAKLAASNRLAGQADVVFLGCSDRRRVRGGRVMGIEKHPEILRVLDKLGVTYSEGDATSLKPTDLAGVKLVILPESNSNVFFKDDRKRKGPMKEVVAEFVRNGGSALVLVDTAGTRNCDAMLLREFSAQFGITKTGGLVRDDARGAFGDPFQILSEDIPASPMSESVKCVQLYDLVALTARPGKTLKGAKPFPVVNVKGGAAVMGSTYGAGRVVIASDISLFAPLRVDQADNAVLMANMLGWLLRKEVDREFRDRVKGDLFLDEARFRQIREEERRDGANH